jgi:hypothetical protein
MPSLCVPKTYEIITEELYENESWLFGLDIGVASTVIALSAARCVPFSSCNGGAYGGSHHEFHLVVAFYARPNTSNCYSDALRRPMLEWRTAPMEPSCSMLTIRTKYALLRRH